MCFVVLSINLCILYIKMLILVYIWSNNVSVIGSALALPITVIPCKYGTNKNEN